MNQLRVKSFAYVHEGGTKYYRIIELMLKRGHKTINAFYTNYGALRGDKDLAKHKSRDGGTSSVEYCSAPWIVQNKREQQAKKKIARGYVLDPAHTINTEAEDESDENVFSILRNSVGLTEGQYDEILEQLFQSETTMTREIPRALQEHIDAAKSKLAASRPGRLKALSEREAGVKKPRSPKNPVDLPTHKMPAEPQPEPVRCSEWGSW